MFCKKQNVAECSLKCLTHEFLQVTDAARLNTLFWIGFMLGRGSGIFIANYFQPTTLILYDLLGTTVALVRTY